MKKKLYNLSDVEKEGYLTDKWYIVYNSMIMKYFLVNNPRHIVIKNILRDMYRQNYKKTCVYNNMGYDQIIYLCKLLKNHMTPQQIYNVIIESNSYVYLSS